MQTIIRAQRPLIRLERNPVDFATIFFGLALLTLLLATLFWQFWHVNRIYTGVTVANVPIGGLTRARAVQQLSEQLDSYPLPPVMVEYEGQQWPLVYDGAQRDAATTANMIIDVNLTTAVNKAYLVGREGTLAQQLAQQLLALLAGYDVPPAVTVDSGEIRHFVSQIASAVRRPARASTLIGTVTVPAQAGVDVNVDATAEALLSALTAAPGSQPVVIKLTTTTITPPEISAPTATQTTPSTLASGAAMSRPLRVYAPQGGLEFALDPAELSALVYSRNPVNLDTEGLRRRLAIWAEQVDVPARDARLQFNTSTSSLSIMQTSQTGRRLDIDATIAAIEQAIADERTDAPLIVVDVPPAVDMNRINEMGINELVASGTTYFAGSSAARIHNIEVAASKFEGVVIPPGGVFSFNKSVEDVSAANGFEDSLIIWGDQTAVGVGGGVCQVSTTVFRAAYEGGFPIVERYNHGYVVDWYGDPGLDATIFTPTVDFKFRNDTQAYILIDPVVDSVNGVITFNFWGTKPDRQVILGERKVTEIVEPEPPTYRLDEELAPGQKKQVEWEQKGQTVEVERTIIENGQTRTDTLVSQYRPWQAVILYGPGTEVPVTPTPVPTAVPVSSP